ncbi:MAG: spore germination protein [Cellulosilyticaceae bacterium]
MKLSTNLKTNLGALKAKLPIGSSFDILEKVITVHDRKFYLYFLDGLTKDTNLEYVRRDMIAIDASDFHHITTAKGIIEKCLSAIEVSESDDLDTIITAILSGQTAMLFDGADSAVLLDMRTYPVRGVGEPEKEKTLRGARDGFVETIVFNTALVRRRIRDPHLVFEMVQIGKISKTDVAIGYMSDRVNKKALKKIKEKLETLEVDALTVGDQSLIESIHSESWINPFPKVRYTERPDIAAAQVAEGKVLIVIDNTPSVMILPTSVFDFMQDVDDYYMPILTGNYLRFVRNIISIANLFLTPVYVLLIQNEQWVPDWLGFILPQQNINVPLFVQFLILEVAIDGLKIASLNTPSSLGMSLSVIGGLILGEYAVKTGWLIPHAILYMSIVALSSFTQPSIELSYAIKFMRIILLIGTGFFGVWGFAAALIVDIILVSTTKSFTGEPYLYPLIPFNWDALKHLVFRTKLSSKQKVNSK